MRALFVSIIAVACMLLIFFGCLALRDGAAALVNKAVIAALERQGLGVVKDLVQQTNNNTKDIQVLTGFINKNIMPKLPEKKK